MSNVNLEIMKTRKLLSFLFTVVLVLFVCASFAQTNETWLDMTGTGGTDSVTVNTTLPYYVEPDPILNGISGQYDPGSDNATNNVNSIFNWSVTGGASFNDPAASGADAPYNTVTFTGTGAVTIEVFEESSAGCVDPTPSAQTVEVIPAPSITVDDGTLDLDICEGPDHVTIASLGADGIGGESNYEFLLDIDKRLYEGDGVTEISDGSSPVYTHIDTIIQVDTVDGSNIVLLRNYPFTCGTDGSGDKRITEYRFDFGSTVDATLANGVTNHISRKSDYLNLATTGDPSTDNQAKTLPDHTTYGSYSGIDNYTWYFTSGGDADADMITVTVYPTPDTEPIQYVPRDFDL